MMNVLHLKKRFLRVVTFFGDVNLEFVCGCGLSVACKIALINGKKIRGNLFATNEASKRLAKSVKRIVLHNGRSLSEVLF
jgi:hypothetical protein